MARPKTKFNKVETPEVKSDRGTIPSAVTLGEDVVPVNIFSDTVVEKEAVVPEAEVTEEMKAEQPINTPETAVPVVETVAEAPKKSFKERMEECSNFFNQAHFDKVAKSGCDYKSFGDWQKAYCALLDRVFGLRNKEVLDVGSAYGALGNGFKQLGAKKVTCVDISKQVVAAKVFDSLTYVLAPVQMMKAITSAMIDFVHASYVLNSVEAEDLEMTFAELKRVLAPNGKIFIIMNFGRDNKVGDYDFRHSKETIVKAAEKAGLKEVSDVVNMLRKVDDGRYEFISNYNWGIVCFE